MKYWRCPECLREKGTEDNVTICICKCCLIKMKIFPYHNCQEVIEYGRNRG